MPARNDRSFLHSRQAVLGARHSDQSWDQREAHSLPAELGRHSKEQSPTGSAAQPTTSPPLHVESSRLPRTQQRIPHSASTRRVSQLVPPGSRSFAEPDGMHSAAGPEPQNSFPPLGRPVQDCPQPLHSVDSTDKPLPETGDPR